MVFTKQHIPAKVLCIIDIGSYKLRVCAASFLNQRIEVLGYNEKRQDTSYFSNQECKNLPGLCRNISESIEKLEKDLALSLDEIVINYPFGELFLASKKIHHTRKHPHTWVDENELESIMEVVEKQCLKHLSEEVDILYGLTASEIQILLSRVNGIRLDGVTQEKIIGKKGETMTLSLVNAFIPLRKYHLLSQIGQVLGKKIFRILPTEFCITKIFPQEDIVIINVGATQTTLSLKQEGEVRGVSKISIGINDLVNKIAKHSELPRAEIIDMLSEKKYEQEKQEFLQIWGESIGVTLQDMLGTQICPKYFYIGGGGGSNSFLKEYLEKFSFTSYDIRILNHIEFIQEDISDMLHSIKSIKIEDIQRIPLDMHVLLFETNHLISQEWDVVSTSLKNAIQKLGYIRS